MKLSTTGLIVIAAPYRDRVTNPPEAGLMIRYRSALHAEMQRKRIPFLEIHELTEAAPLRTKAGLTS